MPAQSLGQSFRCAFSGVWHAVRSGRNAKIQLAAAIAVVGLGWFLRLPVGDWALLVLTIGAVLAAEVANTSVEALVDLASPQHNNLARIAKDAAAGAVLCLAVTAAMMGLLILGPPLYAAFRESLTRFA